MTPPTARARPENVRLLIAATGGNAHNLTAREVVAVRRYRALRAQVQADIAAALGDKYSCRRRELAEIFGVEERTINRWSKAGKLPQSKRGVWDIRDALHCLISQIEGRGRAGTPGDRLKIAKALRLEMRLEHERGQVVNREAVKTTVLPRLDAAESAASSWKPRFLECIPGENRQAVAKRFDAEVADFLAMLRRGILEPLELSEKQSNV